MSLLRRIEPPLTRAASAGLFVASFVLMGACDGPGTARAGNPSPGAVRARAPGFIPAERKTAWNPGVPDGIPVRTRVCATVEAAAHGNGAADASRAIQTALGRCPPGQVVELSAGVFKIGSTLTIAKGVVLRGRGPGATRLEMPVGTNANVVTLGTQWWKFVEPTDLTADAAKGTQSATLKRNPGLAAGELVVVDQLTNPEITQWSAKSPPGHPSRSWFTRPDRPIGQVMEVASVRGNTVTFTTPFHIAFETAFRAQLTRFAAFEDGPAIPPVKNAGLEDLYVSGGSQGQGNIQLSHASYSWVKNVESDKQDGASVALAASFRCVVRDSYIHSTQNPTPGGGGYGISVSWYSADNLIENNVVWNMNKVMVMRASGGGNVIGYNDMEDGWISGEPGWVEVGLNASHMTCPHYELFEGNESFNFDGDNTWGNAVYITVFRNHLTGKRRSLPPLHLVDRDNRRAIGLMEGHMWYTIVGNVLGTADQDPAPSSRFVYEAPYPWTGDPIGLFRLGYNPENWPARPDPRVLKTLMRAGNFDYATREVHWEDLLPQPLPDSLYLSGKPSFFGDRPWPWVDPAGTRKLETLPARVRTENAAPPVVSPHTLGPGESR